MWKYLWKMLITSKLDIPGEKAEGWLTNVFFCVWFFNAPFHFREENKLRKDKLKILFKNKRENEKRKVLNNQSSSEQHQWALLNHPDLSSTAPYYLMKLIMYTVPAEKLFLLLQQPSLRLEASHPSTRSIGRRELYMI